MHWHAGNALAQTVLTCRYVHHVKELNALHKTAGLDGGTPHLPLLSLALRAGIVGLLKCCDLSYRELVKGQVLDVRSQFDPITSFRSRSFYRAKIGKARSLTYLC